MTDRLDHTAAILSLSDSGEHPQAIALALTLPAGRVYAVLRQHRPKRTRKPRVCTSDVPEKVRGLRFVCGYEPPRIAALLDVSRAYVYRILAEAQ